MYTVYLRLDVSTLLWLRVLLYTSYRLWLRRAFVHVVVLTWVWATVLATAARGHGPFPPHFFWRHDSNKQIATESAANQTTTNSNQRQKRQQISTQQQQTTTNNATTNGKQHNRTTDCRNVTFLGGARAIPRTKEKSSASLVRSQDG